MSKLQNDKSSPVTATVGGMTPNQFLNTMVRVYRMDGEQQNSVLLMGPPGIGKTSIGEQAAEKLTKMARDYEINKARKEGRTLSADYLDKVKVTFRRISAPQMGPEDVKGLPAADRSTEPPRAIWLKPEFLPVQNPNDPPVREILLIDELTAATKATMASLLTLVLDRRVQEYQLPPGVFIIAAGNRLEDRAYTIRLSSALSNRFTHVNFKPDIDSWFPWAWKSNVHESVIAFLRAKAGDPDIFCATDLSHDVFPTPRSWEKVSNFMHLVKTKDKPNGFDLKVADDEYQLNELIKGTVGHGAGNEFITFLNLYEKIPTVEEILKNPDTVPVPETVDGCWAVATSLAKTAKDRKNHKSILAFLKRLPAAFRVVGIRDALRENFDLAISGDDGELGGYMADFIKDLEPVIFYKGK